MQFLNENNNILTICDKNNNNECDMLLQIGKNCDILLRRSDMAGDTWQQFRKRYRRNEKLLKNRPLIENIRPVINQYKIKSVSNKNIGIVSKKLKILPKYKSSVKSIIWKVIKEKEKEGKILDSFRQNFKEFNEDHWNEYLVSLLTIFDKAIFGRQLENKINIKLVNKMGPKADESIYEDGKCDIILSKYYIINFERLLGTLLHEMCHCAQWIVEDDPNTGEVAHDNVWSNWAKKCKNHFPKVVISKTHAWK